MSLLSSSRLCISSLAVLLLPSGRLVVGVMVSKINPLNKPPMNKPRSKRLGKLII